MIRINYYLAKCNRVYKVLKWLKVGFIEPWHGSTLNWAPANVESADGYEPLPMD